MTSLQQAGRMPVEIGVAVVEREGRFLVGPRPAGVALAGLWEFPGGKVEVGETPAEAAVRECWEETGVVVRAVGTLSATTHDYQHGTVRLHFIACQIVQEQGPLPARFQWMARDELVQQEFPAANRELLELLARAPQDAPRAIT